MCFVAQSVCARRQTPSTVHAKVRGVAFVNAVAATADVADVATYVAVLPTASDTMPDRCPQWFRRNSRRLLNDLMRRHARDVRGFAHGPAEAVGVAVVRPF